MKIVVSKNGDGCFLFLHDFFYYPKEINFNYLSQMFLPNSFLLHPTIISCIIQWIHTYLLTDYAY